MIQVGEYNELEVVKELDFGIYLRDGDVEILMPTKWVPKDTKIGDFLNVFIFRDSDDRLIATTVKPLAVAESFAYLEAKYQFDNNVLTSDDYYNGWIMCRIHKKHLKFLK